MSARSSRRVFGGGGLSLSLSLALSLAAALWASAAGAQVFSPGPLSKAHDDIDTLTTCTKCHEEGNQHSNARCNSCHDEISKRQSAGIGYHARVKSQTCAECHKEHKGRANKIIDWGGSKRAWNHGLTGWPLQGAHKRADCKKCHEVRLIIDPAVKKLIEKGRESYLGAFDDCIDCHFDEHRGQEPENCGKCHGVEKWKPAPTFNHGRDSKFALTGQHKKVACEKCHQDLTDDGFNANAFPAPRARTYMQMVDIPHGSCVNCHDDVHHGEFGKNCTQCHVTDGWKIIKQKGGGDIAFHDKTDFPLKGEHTAVACKLCHGPFPGQKAVFKGVKHKSCMDCHFDAHVGQIVDLKAAEGAQSCDRCHSVNGFTAVSYTKVEHQSARLALDGAHGVVACNACHVDDQKIAKKVPAQTKREMERRDRKLLVSLAKIAFPDLKEAARCELCHQDPHGGQFEQRVDKGGCGQCHAVDSFERSTFNHDDSRFPLTGKHKDVGCADCHTEGKGKQKNVVIYRPLDIACQSCHADEHVGQLAKDGVTACDTCHETKAFKPAKFDHDKQSTFPLVGKHKTTQCAKCHVAVDVAGKSRARYKPLPTLCADCHDDEHKGSFDDYVP